jgi:mannose/fructose-specific phosphotransferase system component IIA
LSTRPRTSLLAGVTLALALALTACSEEQSKEIGRIPKKTVDKAADDVQKAMQRGAERLRKEDKE